MRVVANDDGTFVFVFQADEKNFAIHILKGMNTNDPETLKAIERSITEILLAGFNPPTQAMN